MERNTHLLRPVSGSKTRLTTLCCLSYSAFVIGAKDLEDMEGIGLSNTRTHTLFTYYNTISSAEQWHLRCHLEHEGMICLMRCLAYLEGLTTDEDGLSLFSVLLLTPFSLTTFFELAPNKL